MKKILTLGLILATINLASAADIISKDQVMCSADYAPVCAQQTIYCFRAPCPQPDPKTYSNSCQANADGAQVLYKGECELGQANPYFDLRVNNLYKNLNDYKSKNSLTNDQIIQILESGAEKIDNILMTSRLFPSRYAQYIFQKKIYQTVENIFNKQ